MPLSQVKIGFIDNYKFQVGNWMLCVEKVLEILKLSLNRYSACWKQDLIKRKKIKRRSKAVCYETC